MTDLVTVWVDEWQTACCGTPFAVGDAVEWTVRTDVDRTFIAGVTPASIADGVEYAEEHHDGSDEPLVRLSGVVQRVRAVLRRAEHGGRLVDVAGSAERPVGPGADRSGWVVELRDTAVRAPA